MSDRNPSLFISQKMARKVSCHGVETPVVSMQSYRTIGSSSATCTIWTIMGTTEMTRPVTEVPTVWSVHLKQAAHHPRPLQLARKLQWRLQGDKKKESHYSDKYLSGLHRRQLAVWWCCALWRHYVMTLDVWAYISTEEWFDWNKILFQGLSFSRLPLPYPRSHSEQNDKSRNISIGA